MPPKVVRRLSSKGPVKTQKLVTRTTKQKRAFWGGVAGIVLLAALSAAALLPNPVNAQFLVTDPAALAQLISQNMATTAKYVADKTEKTLSKVIKNAGDVAFKNALKVYLGKIAEDTATWVGSGFPGQGPAFITDPKYFANLNDAAGGDFLDSLSKSTFGVSLCDPGLAKTSIDIAIRVGLNPNFCQDSCQSNYNTGFQDEELTIGDPGDPWVILDLKAIRSVISEMEPWVQSGVPGKNIDIYCKPEWIAPPFLLENCLSYYTQPLAQAEAKLDADLKLCKNLCSANRRVAQCTYKQLKNNLHNIQSKTLLGDLPKIFNPKENELGQFLTLQSETTEQAQKVVQQAKESRTSAFGVGPVTSLFGVSIKTPAEITKQTAQEGLSTQNAGSPFGIYTGSPIADAIGIFQSTLTNKLMQRLLNKGLVEPSSQSTVFNDTGGSTGGVAAAKDRFASFATLNVGTGGNMDILTTLASCPVDVASVTSTTPGVVSPDNCIINEPFRQAIEQGLTVKDALGKDNNGLLSDKPLGFLANGQEPDYLNGYPYRSLLILRKYRIIPVGWELAATYIRDVKKQNTSIKQVMDQFDDETSPFYRLIDPYWVLKAPENICNRTGFVEDTISNEYIDENGDEGGKKNLNYSLRYCNDQSEQNFSKPCTCAEDTKDEGACYSETCDLKDTADKGLTCAFITPRTQQVQRREACIDERSCILEKDDGSCKVYGTCVQEKSSWKFNGTSCDEKHASCQTLIDSSGQEVTYLLNTTQPSVCDGNNAGCAQYCTAYNFGTNAWSCTDTSSAVDTTKRFDANIGSCDASANGCTAFIRQTTGTNLIYNSGFENSSTRSLPAGTSDFPGWTVGNGSQIIGAKAEAVTGGVNGTQAIKLEYLDVPGGEHYLYQGRETGTPVTGRTFTMSFSARSDGTTCSLAPEFEADGAKYGAEWEYSFSYTPFTSNVTNQWQQFSYTFTWPDTVNTQRAQDNVLVFRIPEASKGCIFYIDNAQMEEGASSTAYKEYGTANVVHLKRPPAEGNYDLKCTGDIKTDPPACEQYIRKCEKENVGCDLFTPSDGSIAIPGIAGQSCPADFVGCAAFRETPITGVLPVTAERTGKYCKSRMGPPGFEFISCSVDADCPIPPAAAIPGDCQTLISFIKDTGKSCSASEVGCEGYTNLDEVAKGGEGKAAFIKPQLCVPPGATVNPNGVGNFYTWVGSAQSGYQLSKFRYVKSNVTASAPCTNLDPVAVPGGPFTCIDDTPGHAVVDCSASYGPGNPDCAEYYDEGGIISYRLRSLVIEESENCHPFRNDTDSNTYYIDADKSLSCSQDAIGCREYVGNTGSNTRTILKSDFENGTYDPWAGGDLTTESINFGGHSFESTDRTVEATLKDNPLNNGATYTVTFWAKGESNDLQGYLMHNGANKGSLGGVAISNEWNQYHLGPVQFEGDATGSQKLTFEGNAGKRYFLDNIVFTEVTDSIYKIKNSQTACGTFEGCQEYTNRSGETKDILDFKKLCKSEKVGCEALINTRNSTLNALGSSVSLQNLRGDADGSGKIDQQDVDYIRNYMFSAGPMPVPVGVADVNGDGGVTTADATQLESYLKDHLPADAPSTKPFDSDTINTPADQIEYWVNDPQKACRAEDKACRAMGRENIALQKVVGSTRTEQKLRKIDTVYLKDDPDQYSNTLCGSQAMSCDEYKTPEGEKMYFRRPGEALCEVRQEATGEKWYVKGSTEPCPIRPVKNIPPSVPYAGFVGLCPSEASGCGYFLDPVGQGENLVVNGEFEAKQSNVSNSFGPFGPTPTSKPQGWNWDSVTGWALQDYKSFTSPGGISSMAVRVLGADPNNWFGQSVDLMTNQYYVISADIMQETGNNTAATIELWACRYQPPPVGGVPQPAVDVPIYTPDNSMSLTHTSAYGASVNVAADKLSTTEFRRFSGRFIAVLPSNPDVSVPIHCSTLSIYGRNRGQWFDNVSLVATSNSAIVRSSVDKTSCNGEVNNATGCKLFNDRTNQSLTYDVDASPVGGKTTDPTAHGSPASCAAHPEDCDSNVLLKVQPDRVCKQWLAPTTTIESAKPSGQKENLTLAVGTCDKLSSSGECAHFVNEKHCVNNPRQVCTKHTDCPDSGTSGVQQCQPFQMTANEFRCSNLIQNTCRTDTDCTVCSNESTKLCYGNPGNCVHLPSLPPPTCGQFEGSKCLGSAYTTEDFRNTTGIVSAGAQWKYCSNDNMKICSSDGDCCAPAAAPCGKTCQTKVVAGQYPFGVVPQIGASTATVSDDSINGHFRNSTTFEGSGWRIEEITKAEGATARIVTSELLKSSNGIAPIVVDPYLEFTPSPAEPHTDCPDTLPRYDGGLPESGVDSDGILPDGKLKCSTCSNHPGTPCFANSHCPGYNSGEVCKANAWVSIQTQPQTLSNRLVENGAYVITFRARFASKPPDGQNGVDVGFTEGSYGGSQTWDKYIQIGTDWQWYSVGPIELCQTKFVNGVEVPCGGNQYMQNPSAHAKFSPSNDYMLYFLLSQSSMYSGDPTYKLQNYRTSFQNRSALQIDEVSILPAAQTKDDAGREFIPRTCRAYPDSSAITCQYTDDTGKIHAGWQGYCVQKDPKNPNNCLSWLPIDLPAGEQNVFGKVTSAGYSQKSPLFMCTKSTPGGSITKGCYDQGSTSLLADGANCPANGWGKESGFHEFDFTTQGIPELPLNEVERIVFHINASPSDWPSGSTFYIDRNGGSHVSDATNKAREPEVVQPWTMFWCGGIDNPVDRACGSLEYSISNNGNGTDGGETFNHFTNSEANCDALDGSKDATNIFWIHMECKNSENNPVNCEDKNAVKIYKLTAALCDASGVTSGSGWMWIEPIIITRSMCTELVKVVGPEGQNAAWSARTGISSPYLLFDYLFQIKQDSTPFGGVITPQNNFATPELWDSSSENGVQPLYVINNTKIAGIARAGSTYGCTGDGCQNRICNTTGVKCNTLSEINACNKQGGYCIGAGTVKTCQSGTKINVACNTDLDCKDGSAAPRICDYGDASAKGGGQYASQITTFPQPETTMVQHLRLLFANAFQRWNWDGQQYVSNGNDLPGTGDEDWGIAYKSMELCAPPPSLFDRKSTDIAKRYCGNAPQILNPQVNGSGAGANIANGQSVKLSFNTVVDPEQLPLKAIAIDWDDGDNPTHTNIEVIPWNQAPKPNIEDPHVFGHAYINSGSGSHTYHPKIQIVDNWDWCNSLGSAALPPPMVCKVCTIADPPGCPDKCTTNAECTGSRQGICASQNRCIAGFPEVNFAKYTWVDVPSITVK